MTFQSENIGKGLPFSPLRDPAHTGPGAKPKRACNRSATRHLTADQYVRLLGVIDSIGGIATLDEISRALPGVEQPVSAVFDLCDADILCVDWESAFDGDMRVWRIDH